MQIYTVYVLKDVSGRLYKGITNNLERRLFQHEKGKSKWTKNKGPFRLVYSQIFETRAEAMKREKFLKSGFGRAFLKKIIQ